MRYSIQAGAIIDVTKPPYGADPTGKTDCTAVIRRVLDDVMIRQVEAMRATHERLLELSENLKEDANIGLESGRVADGRLTITYPEHEPSNKIIFFPKGVYLVSDTLTYTLTDVKMPGTLKGVDDLAF